METSVGPAARDREHRQHRRAQAAALIAVLAAAGCYQPSVDPGLVRADGAVALPVEQFERDSGVTIIECPAIVPSPLRRMRFSVRTTAVGGRFAPKNVGAIWIERADGGFVRTLELWALQRGRYLYRWLGSSRGDTVDAVTSATLSMHRVHELEWDLTDRDGCPVGQGAYRVVLELTDRSGPGDSLELPFEIGVAPLSLVFDDAESFREMMLELE